MHAIFKKYEDPRHSEWLFMSDPLHTIELSVAYVVFVKILGPKFMENRKPFELKKLIIAFNFFQMLFSIYLFYEFGMGGWLTGEYNYSCQLVDSSNKPSTLRMLNVSWWYFFSKFIDFFDTKFDHVSALHVVHHGIMPLSSWVMVKYYPGGQATFPGFINSLVHIIMYFYYMLSAFGPQIQKYLWWKKYLTTIQMLQFIIVAIHSIQLLFIECDYPPFLIWFVILNSVLFFSLFYGFYNKSYKRALNSRSSNNEKIKRT